METIATHQEILLTIDSSFAHREWAEKDAKDNRPLSDKEQFEKACWNGAVKEVLPEIDPEIMMGKKLWLWQIRETKSFLELEMGDYPSPKEKYFSIDPYCFLPVQFFN